MVVPSDKRSILLLEHTIATDLAKLVRTVNAENQVGAECAVFDQLKNHLRIDTEFEFDLVTNWYILNRLLRQVRQTIAPVVAEDADRSIGEWRGAEFRFLIVLEQIQ